MIELTSFPALFGGATIIATGLSSWFGRLLLKKLLNDEKHKTDKMLERFKSKLSRNTSRELEQVKSQLALHTKQLENEHSAIFSKQIEVMDTTFKALVSISNQASRSLWFVECPRDASGIRAEANKLHQEIKELTVYFSQHRIYLDSEVCGVVSDAISKASDPAVAYVCYLGNYDDHELHTIQDVRDRSWDQICEDLHPAIELVESKFRSQFLHHKSTK